jgi:hypothetical protein
MGNTPLPGENQVLIVSCPGTADCSDHLNWTAPVKVSELVGTHPFGPSPAGCPSGRQCLPAVTATPPCDNDVFYAYSSNGGGTWSDAFKVTPAGSAQWQPWSKVTHDGKVLWVAYYDRSCGYCEFSGCNDITLTKVEHAATSSPQIRYRRVTTHSMSNLTPDNSPVQAGFLGDYMWVDVDHRGRPYTVWADTHGRNDIVEEDVYFAVGPRP